MELVSYEHVNTKKEIVEMGYDLALIGGDEFSDHFREIHDGLMADRGGKPRVAFLPTPAANDGNETIEYWCSQASEKLSVLGATVKTPRVVDRVSANDPGFAQQVREADWVYLGGGYAHVAFPILHNTKVLDGIFSARKHGALISGASAGAMMMGELSIVITPELLEDIGKYWESGTPSDWDPPAPPLMRGFGWLPRTIVAPHFDRPWFSHKWLQRDFLPGGFTLIGIDEYTTMARNKNGGWAVFGLGSVRLFKHGRQFANYTQGDTFYLNKE